MTGPFSKLQKEVQIARSEANDNQMFLNTLNDEFGKLTNSGVELEEIRDLFMPIMHLIMLIWTYSQYYNTPSRLVVLIREISNAIIDQCRNSIDGEKIFAFIKNGETIEAHSKLQTALDTCADFKVAYHEYKGMVRGQWKITHNALFVRLDSFQERCHDLMHLTSTIMQFDKLDNIFIGNTKGKSLSATVMKIYDDFNAAKEKFMEINYDIMDISKNKFEDDFYNFRQKIKELERRLASILTQGFDDADTIIGKFQLLDSFNDLLNRPIIQDELEKKQINLLELYKQDLKAVSSIFMEGRGLVDNSDDRSPISTNMPPVAGALSWTTGLLNRVRQPMANLNQISKSIQDREEYKDVQKLYDSLVKNIREYNEQKVMEFNKGVEDNTEVHLNKYLLFREPTPVAEEGFVRVNFDPNLERLLREVKYLKNLEIEVPERASLLYDKADIYRTQCGRLEIITTMYNEILKTLLSVEKPLLKKRIESMDKSLEDGISKLTWNSAGIDSFISQANTLVSQIDELV
jgi:dynein heavy chain